MLGAVGERVKRRRRDLDLSVEKLSALSGVSTGIISLIERGRANPSMSTLIHVAHGLGESISWLLGTVEPRSPVLRRSERRRIGGLDVDGASHELLLETKDGVLEIFWSELAPGYDNRDAPFSHAGEEFGLVISGTRDVYLEGQRYRLEAGDSIHYDSGPAHWYANPTDQVCIALWVVFNRKALRAD